MELSWWAVLPFVAMLGCIAVAPLVPALARHWERPAVQLGVALVLGIPVVAWVAASGHPHLVEHAMGEYLSFITLLGSLYLVSGGIHLAGDIRATPRNSTLFLAGGAVLASLIGTTGAAMLLIRPILNTTREREHAAHTVIYAIFIIANCGGLLTPLGDPPLFLGMLRGVPFTWTLTLLPQWLFVNALLLFSHHCLDRAMYAREDPIHLADDDSHVEPLRLVGTRNLVWLAGIVASVALLDAPWREVAMIACAAASWFGSAREARRLNEFSLAPILEVAAVFLGIFATMITALQYLAGLAPRLPLSELTFFGFTGGLSSVLDNAPTYATFFELASRLPGDPRVAGVPEHYLVAISLGAVCCGALTYIGNGPNFMVKSVAENHGRAMPSFVGYIGWSVRELLPVLVAMVLLFLAGEWWARALGAALTLAVIARGVRRARTAPAPHLSPSRR